MNPLGEGKDLNGWGTTTVLSPIPRGKIFENAPKYFSVLLFKDHPQYLYSN